jgi:hypothetical protein
VKSSFRSAKNFSCSPRTAAIKKTVPIINKAIGTLCYSYYFHIAAQIALHSRVDNEGQNKRAKSVRRLLHLGSANNRHFCKRIRVFRAKYKKHKEKHKRYQRKTKQFHIKIP